MLDILKENNPEEAAFVERWLSKYQRNYDFSNTSDQATFYEAMLELGRHTPGVAVSAHIGAHVSNKGISSVIVDILPN